MAKSKAPPSLEERQIAATARLRLALIILGDQTDDLAAKGESYEVLEGVRVILEDVADDLAALAQCAAKASNGPVLGGTS